MFVIRPAKPDDLDTLLKLAKMVYFINLPPDRDIIAEKIRRSRRSFEGELLHGAKRGKPGLGKGLATESPLFMFVLEDPDTNNTLGTSQVVARMGSPGNPNLSMHLRKREFFSKDLQNGATHVTAQLVLDESGPTEIGGLILQPSYRGHKAKLGKQLALVRFHFIALHRELFGDRVLAEMMAPITDDGRNEFWEAFGRRFINLSYAEADRFCQNSREFMTSLLPREEIYLSLLPAEARRSVGEVNTETVPARRMLEAIGFKYRNMIDPFDGGPHLDCPTDEISIVKATDRRTLVGVADEKSPDFGGEAIVSVEGKDSASEEFRAVCCGFAPDGSGVRLPARAMELLGAKEGATIGFTLLRPNTERQSGQSKRAAHASA
jgi:arginine N-succinyltransferase